MTTRQPPSGGTTRFRSRADYLVLLLIVLLVAGLSVLVWSTSDVRATVSRTGPDGFTQPATPGQPPQRLTEAWRTASAATPRPVVSGPVVVSGNAGTVTGRDPLTGAPRWQYTRDIPLCTVAAAWSKVLTVYRKDGGLLPAGAQQERGNCSEVTALNSITGARKEQRNGNAELGTRLVTEGSYVTTTGRRLLNIWRADLVQTAEYGLVPDLRNPSRQPRPECIHTSVAAGGELVGVVERCPLEPTDRLSVFRAVNPDPDEADRPKMNYSIGLDARGARIVAMNEKTVAVALPAPSRLLVYDTERDNRLGSYPVEVPDSALREPAPGLVTPASRGSVAVYWFTGSSTIALAPDSFRPLWSIKDTIGPAVEFAGQTLVPTGTGFAVLNRDTGERLRDIPVDRGGYSGPVRLDTIGPMVLEQRGAELVALR